MRLSVPEIAGRLRAIHSLTRLVGERLLEQLDAEWTALRQALEPLALHVEENDLRARPDGVIEIPVRELIAAADALRGPDPHPEQDHG